ncbi:unnamed protein product [Echinostoma caproni]|uniref:Cyclic nucleotide-binding domain-containing protein n=1 Tax=Echinostoma caproni TaxID=27848 RepID=A0A183A9Q8_9TREM|nr:unnamed protein product [Echinostoma caproni]
MISSFIEDFALMHAAVFGNVTTLIQRMYARRSAYQTKNQDLKDFTRAHHIPKPLKQRMLEFFQAMWAINRGIDKEAIMQSFPENVRGDIALHLNREMLSLPIFKSASPGCRKCLAQLITTRFATPGEYLVNRGDLLRYIFLVCSGSLEILGPEGTVVGLLGKCDIFGSDIDERPSIGFSAYDVKSLTYCELQCLALDTNFLQLLNEYPTFRKEFAASLHEELSFNIREGFDPSVATWKRAHMRPGLDCPPVDQAQLEWTQVPTNSISLEPELSQRLDFIDSQIPSSSVGHHSRPESWVKHSAVFDQPSPHGSDMLSWSAVPHLVSAHSCPDLNQGRPNSGTKARQHLWAQRFSRRTNQTNNPTEFSPLGQSLDNAVDKQVTSCSNHLSDSPVVVYNFLNHIHQELRTMRKDIQWITRHITSLQTEVREMKSPTGAFLRSPKSPRSIPTQTSLSPSSENPGKPIILNKNFSEYSGTRNDSLNTLVMCDDIVTSDTSPTDRCHVSNHGSILSNASHLDSPRQASDHKVVKFQLPPRRTLTKQHSGHLGSRSRHSANLHLNERGRIRSTESDNSLPRLGGVFKRASSPAPP